jgi:uncharacterized protein YbaA (DUF1428 family)
MAYVDGFVLVVPKKNMARYRKDAKMGKKVWMKHGALDYKENMLNDSNAEYPSNSFSALVKAKKGEIVFFSYIVYKNRKHRDAVNKKVMADTTMQPSGKGMPYDEKRFFYGGFKPVVEA